VATRPRPDVLPDATAVMDRVATRACGVSQKILGCVAAAWWVSRFRLLSDAQWSLIADLLPVRTGRQGRPFRDARQVVEGIICRYRCGIVGRSRRPPGPGPSAEVSRSASIDVSVAPRLGTTAITDDAAMLTDRHDLLDLSGLAAADQRGELVAVGAVAFGARPVEVALHGAHRHR
jgi:hypothetical protein